MVCIVCDKPCFNEIRAKRTKDGRTLFAFACLEHVEQTRVKLEEDVLATFAPRRVKAKEAT